MTRPHFAMRAALAGLLFLLGAAPCFAATNNLETLPHEVVESFEDGTPRRYIYTDGGRKARELHVYKSGKPQHLIEFDADDDSRGKVTIFWESGVKKSSFVLVDGLLRGARTDFDEQGRKKTEMAFVDGRAHGLEKRFGADGALVATSEWVGGQRHGWFRTYYPTGQKSSEIRYSHGKAASHGDTFYIGGRPRSRFELLNEVRHGDERHYYEESGKDKAIYRYYYGLLHGTATHFYEKSGKKQFEVPYVGGRAHGLERHWYESGKVRFQVNRRDGLRQGFGYMHDEQGNKLAEYPYINDIVHGIERRFYPSGKLLGEFPWVKGVAQGTAYVYYEDGKRFIEMPYTNNVVTGLEKRYYPTGRIRVEIPRVEGLASGVVVRYADLEGSPRTLAATYKGDVRDGLMTTYYRDGSKKGEYLYTQGKPVGIAKTWYPDGKPQSEFPHPEDGSGMERRWHDNGKLWLTAQIDKGQRHGSETIFHRDGWMWAVRPWVHDIKEGKETRFYKSGREHASYIWKANKLNGTARIKAKIAGWLWATVPYVDDLKHGTEVRYARDKTKSALYVWDHGKLVSKRNIRPAGSGPRVKYDRKRFAGVWLHENGNRRRELVRVRRKGVLVEKLYYESGALRSTVPMRVKGDTYTGEGAFYAEDGRLFARVNFDQGRRQGVELRFYETGEKKMEIPYVDDKVAGRVRTFYRDGTIQSTYPAGEGASGVEVQHHPDGAVRLTVPVARGKRHGLARIQDDEGKKVVRLSYVEGRHDGIEVHYHDNGQVRLAVPVVDGKRNGKAAVWTRAGVRWAEVPYRAHVKDGVERRFGPAGTTIVEEHVHKDGKHVSTRSFLRNMRGAPPPAMPVKPH